MSSTDDLTFMEAALEEARLAAEEDEVPVGAVIVIGGEVVARAHDRKEQTGDPTAHAELLALRDAAKEVGSWRLENAVCYVTLEPCPMCAGAMIQARIQKVVYGAPNLKAGAAGTLVSLFDVEGFNHHVEVEGGVMKDACAAILSEYFQNKRRKND